MHGVAEFAFGRADQFHFFPMLRRPGADATGLKLPAFVLAALGAFFRVLVRIAAIPAAPFNFVTLVFDLLHQLVPDDRVDVIQRVDIRPPGQRPVDARVLKGFQRVAQGFHVGLPGDHVLHLQIAVLLGVEAIDQAFPVVRGDCRRDERRQLGIGFLLRLGHRDAARGLADFFLSLAILDHGAEAERVDPRPICLQGVFFSTPGGYAIQTPVQLEIGAGAVFRLDDAGAEAGAVAQLELAGTDDFELHRLARQRQLRQIILVGAAAHTERGLYLRRALAGRAFAAIIEQVFPLERVLTELFQVRLVLRVIHRALQRAGQFAAHQFVAALVRLQCRLGQRHIGDRVAGQAGRGRSATEKQVLHWPGLHRDIVRAGGMPGIQNDLLAQIVDALVSLQIFVEQQADGIGVFAGPETRILTNLEPDFRQ